MNGPRPHPIRVNVVSFLFNHIKIKKKISVMKCPLFFLEEYGNPTLFRALHGWSHRDLVT